MSLFENYLYLSDRHENQILKLHRYDQGEHAQILTQDAARPGQIHVVHPVKQPYGNGLEIIVRRLEIIYCRSLEIINIWS
ncbi:hypothetical protein DPMN_184513 [Dreissena polymorpha]|uniref:Uncharacterized protein n=1 Tax=Dreissena polymorpha TaxID=45954 RepID=A0A9D4I7Z1_DREPO|nr:hypothetical protein DPMN_184513 [Dreissena polymorpha]